MTFILADGGIETALVERLGQEIPEFAAFVLLGSETGREALRDYYSPYVALAHAEGVPLALDTPTWRANPDWGDLLGYDAAALEQVQHQAVGLVRHVVSETPGQKGGRGGRQVLVSGCVGPRFDEFVAHQRMTAETAYAYHLPQVRALVAAGVDRVVAVTMIDPEEALGVVQAARKLGCAVAVSFTVGADGLLPNGLTLAEGITAVDSASAAYPVGYFVNCAHPSEVLRGVTGNDGQATHPDQRDEGARESAASPLHRVIGVRLNASTHDDAGLGDSPDQFGTAVAQLREVFPRAETLGGCCGTDVPHITALLNTLTTTT